jgi:hypothetical protein
VLLDHLMSRPVMHPNRQCRPGVLAVLLLIMGFLHPSAAAQDARVQVIHNAPDPALSVVDVYVEEISPTEPLIPNLAFRDATPFLALPSGVPLTIVVAPGNSSSSADAFASFPVTFQAGSSYTVVANGVLAPDDFAANPDGRPTGFSLLVDDQAREVSDDPGEVQFSVVHGTLDAPAVQVSARGAGTLLSSVGFGDITTYVDVPAADYTIDIAPVDLPDTIVASFSLDLRGRAGTAIRILASGFLSPGENQNGPAFGLLMVASDGAASLLPPGPVSNEPGVPSRPAVARTSIHPNPTRAAATVRFSLKAEGEVSIEVFDLLGRRMVVAAREPWPAGPERSITIDTSTMPVGTYVYRLTAMTATGTVVETGRLTVVR